MTTRTTSQTVTFRRPFKLSGADDVQPAGSYTIETDEEQLDTSVLAYRRLATLFRLPGTPAPRKSDASPISIPKNWRPS